jgi:uncharacterized protein YjbI with pentapeptide repeats
MPGAGASPRGPELAAELERVERTTLEHDATLVETELVGADLAGALARGVSFKASRLLDVDLSAARLEHLWMAHCELRGCNLANLHAGCGRLRNASIENARMTGATFPEATLSDVSFGGCRIDLASFGFARLERVTFEDCILTESDFLEAQLEDVRFHDCDLTGADFRSARLQRCELRRCELSGLEGVSSLRGAALEWPQIVELAGILAAEIGIGVLDAG